MNIYIKLFPPLKFPDGQKIRQFEVEDGATVDTLMEHVAGERDFLRYGLESMIFIIENTMVEKHHILKDGQVVEVLLHICGG